MKKENQEILRFNYENNLREDDFYVSNSNAHVYNLLNKWPKWEKNFLNIIGENFSGKTHLVNIFLKKFSGIKLNTESLNHKHLQEIKINQNIVLENFNEKIDEKLVYSLFNLIDQDNKYLIVTSLQPIVDINFNLVDLKSRAKNFLLYNIEKPDDELMFALLLKNLSDRQILIDKKMNI